MFKSTSFIKLVSLSLISIFIIITTGCSYSPRKEKFLKTETYLTDKKISKIELSPELSEENGKYLIVKPNKIMKQDVMKRDVYNKWTRYTKDGDFFSALTFPVLFPIYILLGNVGDMFEHSYGTAGPWQGPKIEYKNKKETGKVKLSNSTDISSSVQFKAGAGNEYVKVNKGQAKLFLPDFIIKAFNIRPKNDVNIDISLRESSYKEGSAEGKATYRVTRPHMDTMQMVSPRWLSNEKDNELKVLEGYSGKGNERASYLAGLTGYEYWVKGREKNPEARDLILQYLEKVQAFDDKFMNKTRLNQALGHLYYDKKEYSKAIPFLEKQNTYLSNKLLGLIYQEQNNYTGAKIYFERALSLANIESYKTEMRDNIDKANMAIITQRDAGISVDIKKDKYLTKLGHFIEEKRYQKTFLYFSLLDDLKKEISIPKSVTYFKGFVYFQLKDRHNALKYLNEYMKETGKEGKHYSKTLEMILKLESA